MRQRTLFGIEVEWWLNNMVFRIVVDSTKLQNSLSVLPANIEKTGKQMMKEWGNLAVARLLQQARAVGIRQFRKNRSMFTNTRYEQKSKVGVIVMPQSGLHQDRAKPHWVSSRGKPMLQAWMQRHWGKRYGAFYFRPKPFIRVGLRNAMNKLPALHRSAVRQAITESIRK